MGILILLSAAKKGRHILKLQFPVALTGFFKKNGKMTFYLFPYYPLAGTSCLSLTYFYLLA